MYSVVASGILKGCDALLNLVLDNTTEYLRGMCVLLFVIGDLSI